MTVGEIKPEEACKLLSQGEHAYTAAHNVDFEKQLIGTGFIPGTEDVRPWICSYKIALRLWPEAPGHKLMELRYFLDLDSSDDFDPKLAMPAHRAAADAYVGCHLLRRILIEAAEQQLDIDRLVKWSAGPALLYMCYLKKHKGVPWKDVPKDYLDWIVNKSDITDRDVRATAKYWLKQAY
jgi:exodeoxyribonuclease X